MNLIRLIPFLVIALIITACSDEPDPTPTIVPPTQTPFTIIITATPLPATSTPLPTATLIPTATKDPASSDNNGGSNNNQDVAKPAKPVSNIKPNCTARQDWLKYTIVVGDTLGRLATQTGSSLNALANANCLVNANVIVVGQTLRVPKQPDKGDDPDPIIEDLITQFNISQSAAVPGETITLSWIADAGTKVTIVNKTLNTSIIGSDLPASGALTYTVPNTIDPDDISALTFNISGKLVRDGEDVFANTVNRTITIQSPLDDDCDADQSTTTTDDDCEEPDDCDADQSTTTTDDDCEEPNDDDSDDDTNDDDSDDNDDSNDDSDDDTQA